jgi:cell division GTPase FtsZ
MTFLEIAEALTYLQDNTPIDAEIIPGVLNSSSMEDRVEVILVITGIGGKAIEVDVDLKKEIIVKPATSMIGKEILSQPATNKESRVPVKKVLGGLPKTAYSPNSMNDLDIPAFLRRKIG